MTIKMSPEIKVIRPMGKLKIDQRLHILNVSN